jgi:hypothetical protein
MHPFTGPTSCAEQGSERTAGLRRAEISQRTQPSEIFAALSALGLRVEHPDDEDLLRAAELMEVSDA